MPSSLTSSKWVFLRSFWKFIFMPVLLLIWGGGWWLNWNWESSLLTFRCLNFLASATWEKTILLVPLPFFAIAKIRFRIYFEFLLINLDSITYWIRSRIWEAHRWSQAWGEAATTDPTDWLTWAFSSLPLTRSFPQPCLDIVRTVLSRRTLYLVADLGYNQEDALSRPPNHRLKARHSLLKATANLVRIWQVHLFVWERTSIHIESLARKSTCIYSALVARIHLFWIQKSVSNINIRELWKASK